MHCLTAVYVLQTGKHYVLNVAGLAGRVKSSRGSQIRVPT